MQGRSKRNSNPDGSYTSRSASTIYNNKPHQIQPLSPSPVQQISPSWSKHKKTRPCPLPIKKLGKREEIPKKMRNFVGAFDCIDKLKHALRQPFAQQKQLFTHVSATPEAEPTKKKKTMENRNYLTTSYFGGVIPYLRD